MNCCVFRGDSDGNMMLDFAFREIKRTKHENHPELVPGPVKAGHDEVVLEDDEVSAGGVLPLGGDHAGGHRTLLLDSQSQVRVVVT